MKKRIILHFVAVLPAVRCIVCTYTYILVPFVYREEGSSYVTGKEIFLVASTLHACVLAALVFFRLFARSCKSCIYFLLPLPSSSCLSSPSSSSSRLFLDWVVGWLTLGARLTQSLARPRDFSLALPPCITQALRGSG